MTNTVGERSITISLSVSQMCVCVRVCVCLYVCEHISGTARLIITKFVASILCGRRTFMQWAVYATSRVMLDSKWRSFKSAILINLRVLSEFLSLKHRAVSLRRLSFLFLTMTTVFTIY